MPIEPPGIMPIEPPGAGHSDFTLERVLRDYGEGILEAVQRIVEAECCTVRLALKQALHIEHAKILEDTARLMEQHVVSNPV